VAIAYGSGYQGRSAPILTPQLVGIEHAHPSRSRRALRRLLRGCPVKIDIPTCSPSASEVVRNTERAGGAALMRGAAWLFGSRVRSRWPAVRPARANVRSSAGRDPAAPRPLAAWTRTRDLKPSRARVSRVVAQSGR